MRYYFGGVRYVIAIMGCCGNKVPLRGSMLCKQGQYDALRKYSMLCLKLVLIGGTWFKAFYALSFVWCKNGRKFYSNRIRISVHLSREMLLNFSREQRPVWSVVV